MAAEKPPPRHELGPDAPTARRIKKLRAALGFHTKTAFAVFLGIDLPRLSNVENGLPLGLDLARKIRQKIPGVTLDWLYEGDLSTLRHDLATKLQSGDEPARAPGSGKGSTTAAS